MYWWCELVCNQLITILPLSVIFIEYDLEMIKVWQKQSWDKLGQLVIVQQSAGDPNGSLTMATAGHKYIICMVILIMGGAVTVNPSAFVL